MAETPQNAPCILTNSGQKGDDLLWELSSDRPIYFWLLEDSEKHKPFIARISIDDTPLGRLNVYTNKVTVKD